MSAVAGSRLREIGWRMVLPGALLVVWYVLTDVLNLTHPVMLPTALEFLDQDDRIEKLITTNTVPLPSDKRHPKIEVLSVAPMLADIISRVHRGVSISEKLILA